MTMTSTYTSLSDLLAADIFDTRDLLELIEYLADEGDESGELVSAAALADDLRNYAPDFEYGATVIADRYFEDYARELADDIGAVSADGGWPTYCIDWAWAARELQMDYSAIEFHGRTYWVR